MWFFGGYGYDESGSSGNKKKMELCDTAERDLCFDFSSLLSDEKSKQRSRSGVSHNSSITYE